LLEILSAIFDKIANGIAVIPNPQKTALNLFLPELSSSGSFIKKSFSFSHQGIKH